MMQFEQNIHGGTRMGANLSKNSKVKVSVRTAGTDRLETDDELAEKKVMRASAKAAAFSRTTDRVAKDGFAVRNQPIPKAKEMFPLEWKMQFAELFYPYAEGGPLYIDLPHTAHDVALCERKLKVMREAKLRYTYMKPGEGEFEAGIRLDGLNPDQIKADQSAFKQRTEA